jgi:hypothetical protein
MKFSEFGKLFDGNHAAYYEFFMLLVEPDVVEGDDIDVQITNLRDVGVDRDKQRLVFFSSAGSEERAGFQGLGIFGSFIDAWPVPEVLQGDYELLIQLPLAEEDVGKRPQQLVPLAGAHVGVNSGEVWLLVRPISEYSPEVLPD